MQRHTNLQKTLLQLFVEIELYLKKPLRMMLTSLIVCLLENNKANISRLGECLEINSDANVMGCMQRIRRFLSNRGISPAITVLPLIRLMHPLLSNLSEIVLAIDRTDWEKRKKYINILTVAISYKGRAIPVYWKVSGRKGSSSFEDWKDVLKPVITGLQQMDWLSGKTIPVVADREFASPKLAEWLKIEYGVDATLRIKASMYLKSVGDKTAAVKIASLLVKMVKGSRQVLYNQIVTLDSNFAMNILLKWDKGCEEAMVVATTLNNPDSADEFYGQRFGIEAMHKDLKSNAFELEKPE